MGRNSKFPSRVGLCKCYCPCRLKITKLSFHNLDNLNGIITEFCRMNGIIMLVNGIMEFLNIVGSISRHCLIIVMKCSKIITNLSRGLIKIDTLLTKLCTCMFLLLALHFIHIPGLWQ